MLHPGLVLVGRYRLLAVLGAGGSAVAWRALDLRGGVEVCVKAVPLEGGGAEVARLEQEASVRVRHPAVARVLEVHEAAGHALIVMELAEGSLHDRVRLAGPLSPAQAVTALRGPLQALAAAHVGGLVHRDVKPSNLLCFADGAVRLADWGAARILAGGEGLTRTGALVGSIPFMAPEQRRDARMVSPATDVYAMAVTLTWMCLGEPPEDLYAPGATERLAERFPPRLVDVLARAGAHDPAERPTATTFSQDLLALGFGEAPLPEVPDTRERVLNLMTPPPAVMVPQDPAFGQERSRFVGLASVMLALLGTAGVAWTLGRQGTPATVVTAATPETDALPPACPDALERFAERVLPGPLETMDATAYDIDGDGILDPIFVNQGAGTLTVRAGDREGRFPERATWEVGRGDTPPVFGDFDGDGITEVILAQPDENRLRHAVLRGGHLSPWSDLFQPIGPRHTAALDWNRDGLDDVMFLGTDCVAWRAGRRSEELAPHVCIEDRSRVGWTGQLLRVGGRAWPLVTVAGALQIMKPGPGGSEGSRATLVDAATWERGSLGAPYAADADGDGASEVYAFTREGSLVRWKAQAPVGDGEPSLGEGCTLLAAASIFGSTPPAALEDVDDDGGIDVLQARSCAGCTSNQVVGVGVR